MEGYTSIIKLLGLPESFGGALLIFIFILCLAPYLSGHDFGLFRIPRFSDVARKRLKIIGPVIFLSLLMLFAPLIRTTGPVPSDNANRAYANGNQAILDDGRTNNANSLPTPTENHVKAQQHIARAQELYGQREYDKAIKECEDALDLEPQNYEAINLKEHINKTKEYRKAK